MEVIEEGTLKLPASVVSSTLIRDINFPFSTTSDPSHLPISYCFSIRELPKSSDWTAVYRLDGETKLILDSFLNATKLSSEILVELSSTYLQALVNDFIHLLDEELVYYERTLTSSECLCCIVIPSF